MQKILTPLVRTLRRSLVIFSLISLLGFGGLLLPMVQPSYAAAAVRNTQLSPEEKADQTYGYVESTGSREAGYEEATKDAESLKSEEKAYERNLKTYKQEQPGANIVEEAKGLLDKVTGNS